MLNLEFAILDWIQQLHTPILNFIMNGFSFLGNGGLVWLIIAVIFLCRKKTRGCGIVMLVAMLLGLIIGNGLLKNLVARQRPCWIRPEVPLLVKNPWDYSFPSGHTMHGFIAAMVIFRCYPKQGVAALVLAGLIAFSRMYLYVHFPTDILGGLILGIIIAIGTAVLYDKVLCRKWERLPKLPERRTGAK